MSGVVVIHTIEGNLPGICECSKCDFLWSVTPSDWMAEDTTATEHPKKMVEFDEPDMGFVVRLIRSILDLAKLWGSISISEQK